MINGNGVFNYIDRVVKVNTDGEKYLALNVLSKDNKKISFITKDEDLINKVTNLQLTKFQDVKLFFNITRIYNKDNRYSFWSVELIGVG